MSRATASCTRSTCGRCTTYADSSQNLMLKHGDIVNVLDRSQQKVFVMGEVRTPKSVEIINGQLTLAGALGEVGGVNQTSANSGAIYVIRGTDKDQPQIFHLDARYASGLLLAERFDMQAQDVVFVDTAGISQWNRVISQLLPSISVIGIADSRISSPLMSAIVNNGPFYNSAPDIDEDEIDLGDLLGVLIENRWLIIGITLAVIFALVHCYAFIATPIYKADGLIQVEEKKSGLGDLDINTLFEGDTSVTAEIEILAFALSCWAPSSTI